MEEESDPSVFVPSADALAALSEEEAALAGEGMVYNLLINPMKASVRYSFRQR